MVGAVNMGVKLFDELLVLSNIFKMSCAIWLLVAQ